MERDTVSSTNSILKMSVLSEQDILAVAAAQLKTEDFYLIKWEMKSLDEERIGYQAEHYKLKIIVKREQLEIELNSFIKAMPKQGKGFHIEYVKESKSYLKESSLMPTLLRDLRTQSTENVIPECYFVRANDVIVLEDLTEKGFKMCDIRSQFDMTYCLSALKSLANLHAASIIIEEKERETLPQMYPELMMYSFFVDEVNRPGFNFVYSGTITIKSLIESCFSFVSISTRAKIIKLLTNLVQMMAPSTEYRNVACHGDLWSNNLMVARGPDKLPHMCIVDYQFLRYAPPIYDVLCMLHFNTSTSFRLRHERAMLAHYHSILSERLLQAGVDPNTVLPWDQLERSAATYKPLAIATILIYMNLLLLPAEVIKSCSATSDGFRQLMYGDRSVLALEAFQTDEVYQRRLSQAIMEAVKYFQQD